MRLKLRLSLRRHCSIAPDLGKAKSQAESEPTWQMPPDLRTPNSNAAKTVHRAGRHYTHPKRQFRMFGPGHSRPDLRPSAGLSRHLGTFQDLDRVPGMEQQMGVLSEHPDGFVVRRRLHDCAAGL